jgi:hypothetical protein
VPHTESAGVHELTPRPAEGETDTPLGTAAPAGVAPPPISSVSHVLVALPTLHSLSVLHALPQRGLTPPTQ